MSKNICTAIADGDRIELVIKKGEKGYEAFAKVIDKIYEKGFFSWYGDVVDADNRECSGLVITNRG